MQTKKNFYRRLARIMEQGMSALDRLRGEFHHFPAEPELLRWLEQGEDLYERYKFLRDKER